MEEGIHKSPAHQEIGAHVKLSLDRLWPYYLDKLMQEENAELERIKKALNDYLDTMLVNVETHWLLQFLLGISQHLEERQAEYIDILNDLRLAKQHDVTLENKELKSHLIEILKSILKKTEDSPENKKRRGLREHSLLHRSVHEATTKVLECLTPKQEAYLRKLHLARYGGMHLVRYQGEKYSHFKMQLEILREHELQIVHEKSEIQEKIIAEKDSKEEWMKRLAQKDPELYYSAEKVEGCLRYLEKQAPCYIAPIQYPLLVDDEERPQARFQKILQEAAQKALSQGLSLLPLNLLESSELDKEGLPLNQVLVHTQWVLIALQTTSQGLQLQYLNPLGTKTGTSFTITSQTTQKELVEQLNIENREIIKNIRKALGDILIQVAGTLQQAYEPDSSPLLLANAEALLKGKSFLQGTEEELRAERQKHETWVNPSKDSQQKTSKPADVSSVQPAFFAPSAADSTERTAGVNPEEQKYFSVLKELSLL